MAKSLSAAPILTADKTQIYQYWNCHPCGANLPDEESLEKFSRPYFDAIEALRYRREPEVMQFAQFSLAHGLKVLEVGIGVGTDFVQWVRSGADAYGIDLTPESIDHVKHRLDVYGLHAREVRLADCEDLPYPDDSFDLIYSWGVIHHTPNTGRALAEIVRVCRPGGVCKVMVYNRHSFAAFYVWLRWALLHGRPWKSFAWCIGRYVESAGTKAFTAREVRTMLKQLPIADLEIHRDLTYWDTYRGKRRWIGRIAGVLGNVLCPGAFGWFMTVQFQKQGDRVMVSNSSRRTDHQPSRTPVDA